MRTAIAPTALKLANCILATQGVAPLDHIPHDTPCDYVTIRTRTMFELPADQRVAYWFGNIATRRALAEVRQPRFDARDIVATVLRKPHCHLGDAPTPERAWSPIESRKRVLRAVERVVTNLSIIPRVEVYGRYHSAPMYPRETDVNVHADTPNKYQPDDLPMALYESEMTDVRDELMRRGYITRSMMDKPEQRYDHQYTVTVHVGAIHA